MSQYVNFFIGSEKDRKYFDLASYSRSTEMYRLCQEYTGYETGTVLTGETIGKMIADAEIELAQYENRIIHMQNILKNINEIDGNIQEKIEAIESYEYYIVDCEETISAWKNVLSELWFMRHIIEENQYVKNPGSIYFGIEWCPDGYEWE